MPLTSQVVEILNPVIKIGHPRRCAVSKNFFFEILNSDTKPQICDIPWPYVEKKNILD